MGCGNPTETIRDKLVKTLYDTANQLLRTADTEVTTPTYQHMERVVYKVLDEKFEDKYGYRYEGQGSQPPNRVDDYVQSSTGLVNYDRIDEGLIDNYVDNNILKGLGLGWIKNAARADLIPLAKLFFKKPVSDYWKVEFFEHDYQNQDKVDDDVSYRANAVFLSVHASREEDKEKVDFVITAYRGVYFKVKSPNKIARDLLLDIVISNAKQLPGASTSSASLETDQIDQIVKGAAIKAFNDRTGLAFGPTLNPKDKVLTASSADVLRSTTALCCPAKTELNHLTSYLKANVLKAMDLPSWLADDDGPVYKQLEAEFSQLLSQNTNNKWLTVAFDQTFQSADPTVNAYRTTSFLIYNNATITHENLTCDQLYLFYIGTFYQVAPPTAQTREDVMVNLIAGLTGLISNPPQKVAGVTPATELRTNIQAYAIQQFQDYFGYEWSADPPNLLTAGRQKRLRKVQAYYYIQSSDFDYGRGVRTQILGPLGVTSQGISRAIQTTLTEFFQDAVESTTGLYQWNSLQYQRVFRDASVTPVSYAPWSVNLVFVLAHGEMNLDGALVKDTAVFVLGQGYPNANDDDEYEEVP